MNRTTLEVFSALFNIEPATQYKIVRKLHHIGNPMHHIRVLMKEGLVIKKKNEKGRWVYMVNRSAEYHTKNGVVFYIGKNYFIIRNCPYYTGGNCPEGCPHYYGPGDCKLLRELKKQKEKILEDLAKGAI